MSRQAENLTVTIGNKINKALQRLEAEEQRVKEKLELSKKFSGGKRSREQLDEEEDDGKHTHEKHDSKSHKRLKVAETEVDQPKG